MLVRFFFYRARTSPQRWLAWLTLVRGLGWVSVEVLARVEGVLLMNVFAALGIVAANIATETVRPAHALDIERTGRWATRHR